MKKNKAIPAGLFFLFSFWQATSGQINVIQNGSFENCNTNPCTYPNSFSQFQYVSVWQNFELNAGDGNGTGTPDWYSDNGGWDMPVGNNAQDISCGAQQLDAQQGTHYVGIFNEEGIIYDFGAPISDGFYHLTFWAVGCTAGKVQVYTDNEMFEGGGWHWAAPCSGAHSCQLKENINPAIGRHPKLLLEGSYPALPNTWQKFELNFAVSGNGFRYLLITGNRSFDDCQCPSGTKYFFIDNVSLTLEPCCPDHKQFQFYDIPTQTIEVSDKIEIGENIGAPGPTGQVHIQPGNYVEMHAGNSVDIYSGFNPDPNSFLDIHPMPCTNSPDIYDDYNFAPIEIPNTAIVTCDPADLNLTFISLGCATGYEVDIITGNGNTYNFVGPIYSQVVTYCTGLRQDNGNPVFPTSGTTYIGYLRLFNCRKDTLIQFSINPILTGNCPNKTDTEFYSKSSDAFYIEGSDVKLYPNPSSSIITIEYIINGPEKFSISLSDNLGNAINFNSLESEVGDINLPNRKESIDISMLTQGIYYLKLETNEKRIIKRFAVIR